MPPLIDSRAFQAGVWARAPVAEARFVPNVAVDLYEQWQSYNAAATTGDYVLTQASTGAAAISTAAPGVLELDSNSTTSAQGANLQRAKSAFVPASGKSLWAEWQVKVVDTFDKVELFVGLAELDTSIIAASALSTANHIGWSCVTDDGVLLFASSKASTATTKAAATIAEDTWVRLGFFYDGTADTLQQYVNGVATGTAVATANIPKVALYPSFVCQSAGTNDPILHIRPYRVIQLL